MQILGPPPSSIFKINLNLAYKQTYTLDFAFVYTCIYISHIIQAMDTVTYHHILSFFHHPKVHVFYLLFFPWTLAASSLAMAVKDLRVSTRVTRYYLALS